MSLQLALYRALLQPLYPGRTVAAALLFTETPRLIALPLRRSTTRLPDSRGRDTRSA